MEGFFMVWGEGKSAPTTKHPDFKAAIEEAERLAKKEGVRFFVLAALSVSVTGPVETLPLHRANFGDDRFDGERK